MAASPPYKIYSDNGTYLGSLVRLEDCAALCEALGRGTEVRWGHAKRLTIWTQGDVHTDSYDEAAGIMGYALDRLRKKPAR